MTQFPVSAVLVAWMNRWGQEASILPTILIALALYPFAKSPQRYSRFLRLGLILGVGIIAFAAQISFRSHIKNDFLSFRTGAACVGVKDFYGQSSDSGTRESLEQNQFPMHFVRLPFYAAMLYPLAKLSYSTGYVLWQTFSLVSFLAVSLAWPGHRAVVALSCAWSLPVAIALVRGQDIGLLLLIASLSVLFFNRQRWALSGAALAFLAIKWNLVITLPLLLIRPGYRRLWTAFSLTAVALVAISFAVAGWHWPEHYFRVLLLADVSPHPGNMPNLWGALRPWPWFPWTAGIAALAAIVLDWIVVSSEESLEGKMAATLVSGILIVPHVYSYDCAILIPFLISVAYQTSRRDLRYVSLLLLAPTTYATLWSPIWHFIPALMLMVFLILLAMDSRKTDCESDRDLAVSQA